MSDNINTAFISQACLGMDYSTEYLSRLTELYKLSLILKSGKSTDFDNYRQLMILKLQEFEQYKQQLHEQIESFDSNRLKEYYLESIKNTNMSLDESIELDEDDLNAIKKELISSTNHTLIYSSVHGKLPKIWTDEIQSLSEETKEHLLQLDVDKELQTVFDSGVYDIYTSLTNRTKSDKEVYIDFINIIQRGMTGIDFCVKEIRTEIEKIEISLLSKNELSDMIQENKAIDNDEEQLKI